MSVVLNHLQPTPYTLETAVQAVEPVINGVELAIHIGSQFIKSPVISDLKSSNCLLFSHAAPMNVTMIGNATWINGVFTSVNGFTT